MKQLLIFLLLAAPCFGQTPTIANAVSTSQPTSDSGVPIYPYGTLSTPVLMCITASATSCSSGTLTVGHTYFLWAYRSGSTTAPGAFSGVTNTTITSSTGGNSQGQRAACFVATTTSTVTPTSANATGVAVLDMGLTAATNTASCNPGSNNSGFGSIKLTTGASGANASYGTIPSFTNQNSTSGVLFCGGAPSSTSMTAPSGLTLIASATAGSAPIMSCYFGSAKNSWSATNGAISPNSTWLTYGAEVLAEGIIESRLPGKALSGNALVSFISYPVRSPIITPTPTDDGSDTFVLACDADDGNAHVRGYFALNISSSTTKISYTFNGSTNSNGFFAQTEQVDNIATSTAQDGSCAGGGASTGTTVSTNGACVTAPISCGSSITTTANGSLIAQYALNDGVTCGTGTPSTLDTWTAGSSPWAITLADATTFEALQTQVQASSGMITPSMTQSCSDNWFTLAFALKKASSGSVYSSMNVNRVATLKLESLNLNAHAITINIPGSGNLGVLAFQNQGGFDVTTITSSNPSCTWNQVDSVFGSGSTPANLAGDIQIFEATNCSLTSTTTAVITFGTNTTLTGSTLWDYDISGAATSSVVDTAATNGGGSGTCHAGGSCDIVGSQSSPATPLTVGTLIQPSVTGGIVISMMQILSENVYCMTSPSGALCNPADQNNNATDYYNPGTSAISYTITTNNAGTNGIQNWALRAVHFLAPAAAANVQRRRIGVY